MQSAPGAAMNEANQNIACARHHNQNAIMALNTVGRGLMEVAGLFPDAKPMLMTLVETADIAGASLSESMFYLGLASAGPHPYPASIDAPADLTGDTLIQQPMPDIACEAGA